MSKNFSKDKQPWNPFPLASLKVEGLTACAKSVLIYLAARSNYKGETCVGHRTMCRELVRSKDFITKGLAELVAKGIVKAADRNRASGEAMWRTINPSVLTSRTIKAESQSCPTGLISPEEQDYVSPAQQGKTLQIGTTPNLAEENLAGFSQLVSKSVKASEPQKEQPFSGSTALAENQNQPQDEGVSFSEKAHALYTILYPVGAPGDKLRSVADTLERLAKNHYTLEYLIWNRGHKTGSMYIRTAEQLDKAIKTGYGINDMISHQEVADKCPVCKAAAKEAEEEKAAKKLCVACGKPGAKEDWFGNCQACWIEANSRDSAEVQKSISASVREAWSQRAVGSRQ